MSKECDICVNGVAEEWGGFKYKRCEEHDRCACCNMKRKDMTETPWTNRYGILCKPCDERNKKKAIKEYQEKVDNNEVDTYSWSYNSGIVCPYCGHESEDDDHTYVNADGEKYECGNCDSVFEVSGNVEVTYCTSRIDD